MKRRIGNDLGLEVAIKRNGRPEDLSALASLKVTVRSVYGAILPFEYSVSGNVLKGVLFGKDQKTTGDYILEIVENEGLESQTVWDGYLLSLVDRTCKEDNEPLDISDSLDFEVEISVAKNGMSAYEIALSQGFVGTMAEWVASLGEPAREAAKEAKKATDAATDAATLAKQSAEDADEAAELARKAGEDAKLIAQNAGKEAREIAEGAAREAGNAAMEAQTATTNAIAATRNAEGAAQSANQEAQKAKEEAQKVAGAIARAESDHLRAETDHILAENDRLDLEETKGRVSDLEKLVPSQASEENKLADREFVNSSIATATATFRGTFERIEDFPSEGDMNDYVFLKVLDETTGQIVRYDRYKWSAQGWLFEYSLNNSSFTQEQWDAINSGINADTLQELLERGKECTEEDILAIFQESDFSEDFNDDYGSNL